ncbi:MAG: flagellar hook basal-body protein [Planctomycetota bacterium]
MINGLYSGASALDVLAKQQEQISNNLMHLNTSGHRRQQLAVKQRFEVENLDASIDLGPEVELKQVDFSEGRRVATGRPLDVAISGDGFLVFDDGNRDYLSRNGRLFRDAETNQLVNEEGFPIQGDGGPITIDPSVADREITIGSDGTIAAAGNAIGTLRIVAFEDNQALTPVGVTGFVEGNNAVEVESEARVVQFQHELSNVQPVSELVALIVNNRQYDAVQKASSAMSDALREYIRE